MKRFYQIGLTFLLSFLLANCANNCFHPIYSENELLCEPWFKYQHINPNSWRPPCTTTMGYSNINPLSMMKTRIPDCITHIVVNGNFFVQIEGEQDHNTLAVVGSNASVREVSVKVINHTLYLEQDCGKSLCSMEMPAVVHLGIGKLDELLQAGNGDIIGKNIVSSHLNIVSTGQGNVFLSGEMNVTDIQQWGNGVTSILGAYTHCLNILVRSNGTVNLTGKVGVQSINKTGCGEINILGVTSNSLDIFSSGSGMINLIGCATNLHKLIATGNSSVYLNSANSNNMYVIEHDNAQVGIAGNINNLNVKTSNYSRFQGRYLHSRSAYVTTQDYSHANILASRKAFAAAYGDSSIYFFGHRNILSYYINGRGRVVAVS